MGLKRKKSERTRLIDRADKLFSAQVRSRGGCESGREKHAGVLQCAHGFSRRYLKVRWDARQCWCLCGGCHMYYTHRPIEWDLFMLDRLGVELYAEIRETALDPRPVTLLDLVETIERLKASA